MASATPSPPLSHSSSELAAILSAPLELSFDESRSDLEQAAVADDAQRFDALLARISSFTPTDAYRTDLQDLSLVDVLRAHNAVNCQAVLERHAPGVLAAAPPSQCTVESLRCPLCREVMFSPIRLFCRHAACRACLYHAILGALNCPVCREPLVLPSGYAVDATLQRAVDALTANSDACPDPLPTVRSLDNILEFVARISHGAVPRPLFMPTCHQLPFVMRSQLVISLLPRIARDAVLMGMSVRVVLADETFSAQALVASALQGWLADWLSPLMARSGGSACFRAGGTELWLWNMLPVSPVQPVALAQLNDFMVHVDRDARHLQEALRAVIQTAIAVCQDVSSIPPPGALDAPLVDALESPANLRALRIYRGLAATAAAAAAPTLPEALTRVLVSFAQHSLASLGNYPLCVARPDACVSNATPCLAASALLGRVDAAFQASELLVTRSLRACAAFNYTPPSSAAMLDAGGRFNPRYSAALPWHVWHVPPPVDVSELSTHTAPLMACAVEADCRTQRVLIYCSAQRDVLLGSIDEPATNRLLLQTSLWNTNRNGVTFATRTGTTLGVWTTDAGQSVTLLFGIDYATLHADSAASMGTALRHLHGSFVAAVRRERDTHRAFDALSAALAHQPPLPVPADEPPSQQLPAPASAAPGDDAQLQWLFL